MWGEVEVQTAVKGGYLAYDFGKVAVGLARQVCTGVLGPLAEKALHFGLPAGAGDAGKGVGHYFTLEQPRLCQRDERQQGAGRVAARVCDYICLLDLVCIDLAEAVNALGQKLRAWRLLAVGLCKQLVVLDTEVCRKVNHHAFSEERLADLCRLKVRKSCENHIRIHGNSLFQCHQVALA